MIVDLLLQILQELNQIYIIYRSTYQSIMNMQNQSIMSMQNLETASLFDILSLQANPQNSNHNFYAISLAKSRQQSLTQPLLNLIYELYIKQGNKWLEVINRMLNNNFNGGYCLCLRAFHFYRPIISLLFQVGSYQQQLEMHKLLEGLILSIEGDTNIQDEIVKLDTVALWMEKLLLNQKWQFMSLFRDFLCNNSNVLEILIRNIRNFGNTTLIAKQKIQAEYYSIEIIKLCAWYQAKLQNISIRNLYYLKAYKLTVPIQQFLIHTFSSIIPSFLSEKLTLYLSYKQIKTASNAQINQLYDLCCSSCKAMSLICSLSSLGSRILAIIKDQRNSMAQVLLNIFIKMSFVSLNRHNNYQQQFILLSYEVINGRFSDTLAGEMAKLVSVLCENYGQFLNVYSSRLLSQFKKEVSNIDLNISEVPIHSLLLKFIVPVTTFKKREDILSMIHEQIFANHFINFQTGSLNAPISQLDKLGLLLYMIAYSEHINEKTICFSYRLCLNTMKSIYGEHWKSENMILSVEDNFWFVSSYDLLIVMLDKEHVRQVLNKNLGDLVEDVLNIPLYPTCSLQQNQVIPIQFFEIYLRLLNKFQQLVSRSSSQILCHLHKAFEWEIKCIWGKNKKINPQISKILECMLVIIKEDSEEGFSYNEIYEYIVPVIAYLQDPYRIDFQQQLLEILQLTIKNHSFFSPEIAMIITKLKASVDKNEGKLTIISNIYQALASSEIPDQISYQYRQIVQLLLILFRDYLGNFQMEEYMHYKLPVVQQMDSIQIFIKAYQVVISQGLQGLLGEIFELLKFQIYKLNSDTCLGELRNELKEILIETAMAISHINFSKSILRDMYGILKSIQLKEFTSIQIICLIPICLTDYLLSFPQQYQVVVSEIISFYSNVKGVIQFYDEQMKPSYLKKISREGIRKQKNEIWPKRSKQYIQNGMRQLRGRKLIDQVTHIEFLDAINKIFV